MRKQMKNLLASNSPCITYVIVKFEHNLQNLQKRRRHSEHVQCRRLFTNALHISPQASRVAIDTQTHKRTATQTIP